MATRVLGPTGSRRRRRFLLVSLLLVACTALFLAGSAQAVHALQFQLDGDVSTHAYTTPGGQTYDWGANAGNVADSTGTAAQTDLAHSIFKVVNTASGSPRPVGTPPTNCDQTAGCQDVIPNPVTVPAPFANANFARDFGSGAGCTLYSQSTTYCTSDDTTYATGSKDTLGIGNGGWQCNHDANVNSKIDINNAYIASYWTGPTHAPGDGNHVLYFGVEKNKNNGTNDIGVWFLQDGATCSAPTGHKNFTGQHTNGDVLVVSEFSNGGGVSSVKAFVWRASTDPNSPFFGDGGCIDSRPGEFNPKVNGGCNGLDSGIGGDCKDPTLPNTDSLCSTTNASGSAKVTTLPYKNTVTTPWLSADATLGVGTSQLVPPDFFEGGVDITALFGAQNTTAPRCFNTGVPDTRSSASVTATLFDFTLNTIGECSSSTVTHPQDGSGNNITGDLSIGADAAVQVRDQADITVTGFSGDFHGNVTFYLCGPLALDSTSNCNDTDTVGPPPVVDTHGVQIGSPVTVNGTAGSASVNSSDPNVPAANGNTVLTSVGRYCWRAIYSGDGDVPGSRDPTKDSSSTSECFKVIPVTPSLSTAATCSADPCLLGSTLNDTATLGGAAKKPGTNGIGAATAFSAAGTIDATNQSVADGSITWKLYGPGTGGAAQCTTAITGAPTPSSRTVSDNGDYTTSYTTLSTDKVGKYEFAASYGGDSPNTSAAPDVACDTTGANGEQVTVTGSATSSSKQGWLPNDRITLGSTAGTTLNGTLTVTLYKGTFTGTLDNCATGTVTQEYQQSFTIASATNSDTEFTTNSTFYIGTKPSDGSTGGGDGGYFWLIHYVDNSLTSPNDRCESATITHNDG